MISIFNGQVRDSFRMVLVYVNRARRQRCLTFTATSLLCLLTAMTAKAGPEPGSLLVVAHQFAAGSRAVLLLPGDTWSDGKCELLDVNGCATFRNLAKGKYVVAVFSTEATIASTELELLEGESRVIELEAPGTGAVVGRTSTAIASQVRDRIRIVSRKYFVLGSADKYFIRQGSDSCVPQPLYSIVDEAGGFSLDGLDPGRHELLWIGPGPKLICGPSVVARSAIQFGSIGDVDIVAGQSGFVELNSNWPSVVNIQTNVTLDAKPLLPDDLVVSLTSSVDPLHVSTLACAPVDASTQCAEIGLMPPGEYSVSVQSASEKLFAPNCGEFDVNGGTACTIDAIVSLRRGALLFCAANNVSKSVECRLRGDGIDMDGSIAPVGQVQLLLTSGSYEIEFVDQFGQPINSVTILWPPPADRVLKVYVQ